MCRRDAQARQPDLLDQDLTGTVVFLYQDDLTVPAEEHPFLVTRDHAVTKDAAAIGGIWLSDGELALIPRALVRRVADESELTAHQRDWLEQALEREGVW
jgi:hypothetical protein